LGQTLTVEEMVFIPPGMVLLLCLVIWHIVLELKCDNLGLRSGSRQTG